LKEILSQSEIDSLINAINQGNEVSQQQEEQKDIVAKKYDFRRPNKFTKEQIRTLYMIHENYSRITANFLSGYLRSSISMKIASVEQLTYEDFLVSIPSPTLLTIFQMPPLNGSAVMEFNSNFTLPVIDLLFGGIGRKISRVRELTEIEISVMRTMNQKMLDNFAFVWRDVIELEPAIESLETNPQFNQIIAPNETVAIITFSVTVAENSGTINLCLPYLTLEPVISSLTAQQWFAGQQFGGNDKEKEKYIENCLGKVKLNLSVNCGETHVSLREFLQLREGDVVLLDKHVGNDLDLTVEGYPKFKVQPGTIRNKLAMQITGKF